MKNIIKLLAIMLVVCAMFTFSACDKDTTDAHETTGAETSIETEADETEAETKATGFKVKVVDEEGNAIPKVMVQICKDTCVFAASDENGVASFSVEITDGYKLSVLTCPEGYIYKGEAEVYLESGSTEYTLELAKVA